MIIQYRIGNKYFKQTSIHTKCSLRSRDLYLTLYFENHLQNEEPLARLYANILRSTKQLLPVQKMIGDDITGKSIEPFSCLVIWPLRK